MDHRLNLSSFPRHTLSLYRCGEPATMTTFPLFFRIRRGINLYHPILIQQLCPRLTSHTAHCAEALACGRSFYCDGARRVQP